MKLLFRHWLLGVMFFSSATFIWANGQKEAFHIYYTASFNGHLSGCLCEDNPIAGLAITGAAVHQKPQENAIRVDLGDRMPAYQISSAFRTALDMAFEHIGYDIMFIGDQDIGQLNNSMPLLLPYNLDPKLFSGIPKTMMVRDIKFVGLIEEDLFRFYPAEIRDMITFQSWQDTLDELLEPVAAGKEQAFVLFFHGRLQALETYLSQKQTAYLPLILLAHEQRLLKDYKVARSRIFSPGANGNRIGHLQINRNLQVLEYTFDEYFYSPVSPDALLQSLIAN